MLSSQYSILEASNGKAGLDVLRSRENIGVVLLDIIMPIMDGYEFLQKKGQDPAPEEGHSGAGAFPNG